MNITNYITNYYSHRKWLTQPHNTAPQQEIAQTDEQLLECIDEKTRIVKRLLFVLEDEQKLCGMAIRKSQKLMQEQQGEQAKSEHGHGSDDLSEVYKCCTHIITTF